MDGLLLVYGEVFLAHHELQVVYDDVIDVVHVDSMLHSVQHRPTKTDPQLFQCNVLTLVRVKNPRSWALIKGDGYFSLFLQSRVDD